MFARVDKSLNLTEIEPRILAIWEKERVFEKLVGKNAGGPCWSFTDGPITANNPMGVHHAWGRTYKDIFQRYKAMRGFRQRYQNGFDCQGLWVEVEVEKSLGLNSKREILAHGLDKFSKACRERIDKYAAIQTEQSKRLGQWMDWENSYYTHTDTNIEYIWHFLKTCHAKGWLYKGHRSMPWCIRCGTSLSQHELIDSYKDVTHRSVFIRLPVREKPGHFFLVWTTTPWTLAANVALAVHPELDYVFVKAPDKDETLILSKGTLAVAGKKPEVTGTVKGKDLVGLTYAGPFDAFEAQKGSARRVIPWDAVGEADGTGIVHIAPGCGAEDFELSKTHDLAVLVPIDENGIYGPGYGFLTGRNVAEVAPAVFEDLKARGVLFRIQDVHHRYPVCWRCHEELVFRVVDEWFIRCDEIRAPMRAAAKTVTWIPEHIGKRMDDWLANMGDWCISRKRFWGLPLPFYPCGCGHMTILGSRKDLLDRAVDRKKAEALPELHRPWIDDVQVRCEKCGKPAGRLPEVGDCWLDAGIVPFSTLGYLEDPERKEWKAWFPADFICEMREQVRLWFYSTLFMGVTLENRAPYRTVLSYEKVYDEKGKAMHKSAGNAIWFDDAAAKMGADCMRWMYAGANVDANLRFGYGPATEVRRKLLTLWNVYAFFVEYANIDKPDLSGDLVPGTPGLAELDRWILARTDQFAALAARQYDAFLTGPLTEEAERFFDDLSNWYLRRSRSRFWRGTEGGRDMENDKRAAYKTLYHVLLATARVLAPVLPFTMEEMYRNLRAGDARLPESVHLCDFPTSTGMWKNDGLVAEMSAAQAVVRLGHAARAAAKLRVRQPLAACRVAAADKRQLDRAMRHAEIVSGELNVKRIDVLADAMGLVGYKVRPNLPRLGPRLGNRVGLLQKALSAADHAGVVRAARAGGWTVPGLPGEPVVLSADDLLIETVQTGDVPAAEGDGFVVLLDTKLTPELVSEGRAREVVHHVQALRKARDLPYEARIRLWIAGDPEVVAACRAHETYLREECLAAGILWAEPPSGGIAADVDGKAVRLDLASS